ncbi:uncharacterized protein (TIGR03083 family) [Mycobacterium sp. MAA66]|uniref:maleylpyruvate isomerase family mycothiol-dependent enzyme n=1 Tax=Mycobacterium sp. MAA66 TaxID=3156297 RepID=UPI0035126827
MSPRNTLRANDQRFVTAVSELTPQEWAMPSLCTEWRNHDVLAHLVVGLSYPVGTLLGTLTRERDFDLTNAAAARELATRRSPDQLLADFSRFGARPVGIGRYFPARLLLGDHVTHELDILYAIGREPDITPSVLNAVLDTQVAFPNPFVPAYRNSRGLRLVAADTGWRYGDGPLVEGGAAELISVLGNRRSALLRLRGDGVALLGSRVISSPSRTAG